MTIKARIQAELDNLSEEELQELYNSMQKLANSKITPPKNSLLSRLKQIKIDASEDFSANIANELGRGISEE